LITFLGDLYTGMKLSKSSQYIGYILGGILILLGVYCMIMFNKIRKNEVGGDKTEGNNAEKEPLNA
jgi:hypothetical protein